MKRADTREKGGFIVARAKKVQKAVIYKRVDFHVKSAGENLKTLLDAALRKKSTVGKRRRDVSGDPDDPVWQLLGASQSEVDGFVFGSLMVYSPGKDPLFLIDDMSVKNVTLEKLAAPLTTTGQRRELLESVMFFGAIRNHLVLMQSQALKSAQLEAYFQWFLHDAGVLAGDNTLQLLDTPTAAIRQRVEEGSGVRAIKIGSEVTAWSRSQATDENKVRTTSESRSVSVSTKAEDAAWGPLEAIKKMLAPSDAAKIDFEKLAGSNIELTVTLRYSRTTTDDGHKLMDTLGSAFRNTDDVETEVELIDGTTIKGSDLKLHGKVAVTSYDGQLVESEVNEAMRQWLLAKVRNQDRAA